MQLLKERPSAIFDIHRDGIPDPAEYETTVGNKKMSKVRLLVGKSNQNKDANLSFAKQIKAVGDKQYPGLIKDIFIGKGTYNQDLSPNAILLEFGTHTISKERVLNSTDMMAHVVSTTLFGPETGSAKSAEDTKTPKETETSDKNKSAFQGIGWLLLLVIVGVILFALLQTGGGKAMGTKIGRNLKEMTGGLIGKKKNPKD